MLNLVGICSIVSDCFDYDYFGYCNLFFIVLKYYKMISYKLIVIFNI